LGNEKKEERDTAVRSNFPDAWESMEFVMTVKGILHIKDITFALYWYHFRKSQYLQDARNRYVKALV